MPKLIFLDLETTGLEERDRMCELALILEDEKDFIASSSLCKSPKKISTEAMSLHHITNEMIKDAQPCEKTETYELLQEHNIEENIMIAHNIRFDLNMLEKEGFKVKAQIVDTLRCVKSLIPECEQFNLQFLRYELGLYKDEGKEAERLEFDVQAHRALSDALQVKLLCKTLLEYATVAQLIEISSKPVLLSKLPFGKYSGRYLEEIVTIDPGYLNWMMENIDNIDEDLAYSIMHYIKDLG